MTSEQTAGLEPDYSLADVAQALGMSTRWVRDRIRKGENGEGPPVEHLRYGHKIRFTATQVDKIREAHTKAPVEQSMTTGRKKRPK